VSLAFGDRGGGVELPVVHPSGQLSGPPSPASGTWESRNNKPAARALQKITFPWRTLADRQRGVQNSAAGQKRSDPHPPTCLNVLSYPDIRT